MKRQVLTLTTAGALALFTAGIAQEAYARPGAMGSVRYSGSTSAPVRYQKPMNTPGYSAALPSTSTTGIPTSYQRPMNTGPGERAYRRASDYYYYPGSAGYDPDYGYDTTEPTQPTSTPTYQPAAPPPDTGTVITRLPPGYHSVSYSGKDYFYSQGIFYTPGQGNQYEAVTPPIGLTVPQLPAGATQVKTGLYQYRDVYYRPSYSGGDLSYTVSNP
jgi:hypothetical protein